MGEKAPNTLEVQDSEPAVDPEVVEDSKPAVVPEVVQESKPAVDPEKKEGESLSEQAARFQEMMRETALAKRAEGKEDEAKAAEDMARLAAQLGDDAADLYAEAFASMDNTGN